VAYLQGKTDLGLALTTHALELSRKSGISAPVKIWSAVYYATNRDRLGFRSEENLRMIQSAVEAAQGRNVLPPHEFGDLLYTLGYAFKLRERYAESEASYDKALAVYMQDAHAKCDQSAVYGELAQVKDLGGSPQASLPIFRQAYEGIKACEGPESRAALEQQDRMAGALIELGRAKEALPTLEAILPGWRKIAGSSPDLAEPLYFLAWAQVEAGQFAEAEATARELFSVQDGKVASTDRRIGEAQLLWARALVGEHRDTEALPHAEMAAKLLVGGVSAHSQQQDAQAQNVLRDLQTRLRAA
jgi:tetratricopeptide (TPR) repeat protein